MIHLDRAFQPLAQVLAHPFKQWLLSGVLLEGQMLFLEALLADLDARGDCRLRDRLPVRQIEIGGVIVELLGAMRREALLQLLRITIGTSCPFECQLAKVPAIA